MTREAIMLALFNLLVQSGAYKTTGRRLIYWQDVADQPALFLRHVADDTMTTRTGMPPKVVIECEVWLYSQGGSDPDVSPETSLNGLLDGVEIALQPAPGMPAQTLGGLVTHAWIEGKTEMHPGDLGGQAIAVVPVKVLVPVVHGPTG